MLAEDRAREARAVAEAAEDRALAHARLGGDGLHRHARRAVALEQPRGGVEHEPAVARGVGPLGRLGVDLWEFERDAEQYNWTTVRLRATVIDIKRTTVRIPSQEDTMTAIATPVPTNTAWTVDPVHSTVGFAVKHMVVSTFRGRFEDFDATLTADADGTLRLEGRVAADSIVVKDENLATHLKAPDFFDTERHPYVTFTSTLVRAENGELIVDGELTIKGHTRPIEARGTLTEPAVTFGDVEKVGLELEAIVDRTEYGLTWNAPLPKGGFALANEVKLQVSLELAKA